jgi:hypothetical protein
MEDGEQPELGESGYAAVGWLSAAGGEPEALQVLIDAGATVCAVLANLVPILWESGIGSDVMKPIAAPIVGDLITSIIHVLILVPLFFVMLKERELKKETLRHLAPADQQHQLTTTTT